MGNGYICSWIVCLLVFETSYCSALRGCSSRRGGKPRLTVFLDCVTCRALSAPVDVSTQTQTQTHATVHPATADYSRQLQPAYICMHRVPYFRYLRPGFLDPQKPTNRVFVSCLSSLNGMGQDRLCDVESLHFACSRAWDGSHDVELAGDLELGKL